MSKIARAYEMAVQDLAKPFKSAWRCHACGTMATIRFNPSGSIDVEDAGIDLAEAHADHHAKVCTECHRVNGAAYVVPMVPACVKDADGDRLWLTELAAPYLAKWGPKHA